MSGTGCRVRVNELRFFVPVRLPWTLIGITQVRYNQARERFLVSIGVMA